MPTNELTAEMTGSLILIAVLASTVAYELLTGEKPAPAAEGKEGDDGTHE